ncbi:DUF222 domain-containing protein [Amycolatopsis sp. NPDC059027]|uniref:DUF222 domain-containing protein n=1 Tax=Amycolatopsis sp. NPDC059027 TaxID=3346709 RepID=UPI00367131E6
MTPSPRPLRDTRDTEEREDPANSAFMRRMIRMDPKVLQRMQDDAILQIVQDTGAEIARIQALQLRCIAEFNRRNRDSQSVLTEIASVLSSTEHHASAVISAAEALTTRLPRTLQLMDDGELDLFRAMKVTDATSWLSDEHAAIVDVVLVGRLPGKNATQVRKATTHAAMKVDPNGAAHRGARRRAERRVVLSHSASGVSRLSVDNAPAEKATAAYLRIDQAARALKTPDEERTLDQLRTDVALDLLLNEDGGCEERAEVFLYMDLATYLGLNNDPVEMAGHGHIPAVLARRIAAGPDTALRRIITDPLTGQMIELGGTRYRPTPEMDEFVRVRDRECRQPGCTRPAQNCKIENTRSRNEAGAETTSMRPVTFCPRHRRLKRRADWHYEVSPDDSLTITTPTGRTQRSSAPPFHEPRPDASPGSSRHR